MLPHEWTTSGPSNTVALTRWKTPAFACAHCNGAKGPNAAGFDSETDELVRLFNPRKDVWHEHFVWDGAVLVGRRRWAARPLTRSTSISVSA